MTYCNSFAPVVVTGLSNGWNRGVDLTTLGVTIPADATYAVMEYRAGSGTIYGTGKFGDGVTTTYAASGSSQIIKFVEFSADKKIDLHLTNATGGAAVAQWHVRAILNHLTPIAPASIGAFSGAGTKTIDCSAIVPSGAANGSVLISFNLNMKVGALANITTQDFPNLTPDNHRWVPLDASRFFYVNSGGAAINAGDIKILGWAAPGCATFQTTYTKLLLPSSTSTWDTTGFPVSFSALELYQVNSSSDSHTRGLRTYNDTGYTATQTLSHRSAIVRPDANGQIEGWRNNVAVSFIQMASIVANTAAAAISSIDTFVAGATATVVFDQPVTSVTRLRVKTAVKLADGTTPIDTHTIDITSFSGSGTTWTFTVPNPTDATDGIRLGAVTITPTTSTGVGADFTTAVYSKTGYSSVNIETPASGNICEGDTPALAMDDQIGYQYGSVSVNGIYSDPTASFSGTQTIFHYAVSDFKWYTFTLTTGSGGGGGGTGGLTSSGLTSSGLTRAGLTSAGL